MQDKCAASRGAQHAAGLTWNMARRRHTLRVPHMTLISPTGTGGVGDANHDKSADKDRDEITRQLLDSAALAQEISQTDKMHDDGVAVNGVLSAAEMQGFSMFSKVDELGEYLGGSGRAKLVWKSIAAGKNPFEDDELHANTRNMLHEKFEQLPQVVEKVRAADSTTKMLVRMKDGLHIECDHGGRERESPEKS